MIVPVGDAIPNAGLHYRGIFEFDYAVLFKGD